MKTALAVIAFPFVFALACLSLVGVLIFKPAARAKWFSDRRHTAE